MPAKSDYVTGTISLTNGQIEFTGAGTGWLLAQFKEGDTIIDVTGATEFMGVIATIDANGAGTLTKPWEGPDLVNAAYRMRFQPDGARVSAQARNLIELLGNGTLLSMAGLEGPGVIELLAGGGARVVPKSDLTSGVAFDAQVADIAGRAVYDAMPGPTEAAPGFAVLVRNSSDGRSAVYFKQSDSSGDWSSPAYVTGPAVTLNVTEVDEVPYGTPPDVTLTPVGGGYNLAFEIPRGMIIEPGTTTTLAPDQPAAVTFVPITGGYRLDIAVPRGPTGDINGVTPFWNMRLGSDSTQAAALAGLGAQPAGDYMPLAMPTARFKGRVATGSGPAQDLTAAQLRTGAGAVGAVRRQTFLSSGTYTPHPNMLFCLLIGQAPGGGGGGAVQTNPGTLNGAGGGGGGSYSELWVTRAQIGASQPVTIGAPGSGGVQASAGPGGTGGSVSVGTLMTALGGLGAPGVPPYSRTVGAAGGALGTGGLVPGKSGNDGAAAGQLLVDGTFYGGAGGDSVLGFGGKASINGNGQASIGYGGGGGGGSDFNNTQNRGGGAGGPGIVMIIEFCSE